MEKELAIEEEVVKLIVVIHVEIRLGKKIIMSTLMDLL